MGKIRHGFGKIGVQVLALTATVARDLGLLLQPPGRQTVAVVCVSHRAVLVPPVVGLLVEMHRALDGLVKVADVIAAAAAVVVVTVAVVVALLSLFQGWGRRQEARFCCAGR